MEKQGVISQEVTPRLEDKPKGKMEKPASIQELEDSPQNRLANVVVNRIEKITRKS